ncbi:response regulator transcription factor [Sphingomonas oligophenolica]|uniref:DNA-binding response regulator n=1 Tax=Sphingomonas oligophenolica TaxID=301154 RepID=A0A502CBB6_9SPHN|nr:response regulator transcription factor [Sphingomonas oligophenolica]TPG10032.1 DNA-binding response regulator [Sphingomonas oligophenolica]
MTGGDILVVDDEPAIRTLVTRALTRHGYGVREAADARQLLHAITVKRPDLVLLDLGLPDRDGLELIPQLHATGVAILVLTARYDSAEKVTALDLGADDYVTKPFDTEELLARVRTCLRHRHVAAGEARQVTIGDRTIDLDLRTVTRADVDIHLTPKEFALLAMLAKHQGRVLTHGNLLREVWGEAHVADIEYLRVTIRALRLKLELDPANPVLLRNEPGVGYRLSVDP